MSKSDSVVQPVTPEEIEAAYKVPAPGANKFVVTVSRPGVRITFGELHEHLRVPKFTSAVTLHPVDAITLYKLLREMLKDVESQILSLTVESKDG